VQRAASGSGQQGVAVGTGALPRFWYVRWVDKRGFPMRLTALGVAGIASTHIYGYTGFRMKTTVDLPDDLVIEAKKRAAEQRRSLRSILADGLRAELEKGRAQRRGKNKVRWVTSRGGLPPVDISDRAKMHEWLLAQR